MAVATGLVINDGMEVYERIMPGRIWSLAAALLELSMPPIGAWAHVVPPKGSGVP